jgi:hypothetical protein
MISDLDIYRAAKLLIDQHGEEAPIWAARGQCRYRRRDRKGALAR